MKTSKVLMRLAQLAVVALTLPLLGTGCSTSFPIRRSELPAVAEKRFGSMLVRDFEDERIHATTGALGIEKSVFGNIVNGFTNHYLTSTFADFFSDALETNGYTVFKEQREYYFINVTNRNTDVTNGIVANRLVADRLVIRARSASTNVSDAVFSGYGETNTFERILEGRIKRFWIELAFRASAELEIELTLKTREQAEILWRSTFQARREEINLGGTQSKAEDMVQEVVDDVLKKASREFNSAAFSMHFSPPKTAPLNAAAGFHLTP
jgi:hypothetical protein